MLPQKRVAIMRLPKTEMLMRILPTGIVLAATALAITMVAARADWFRDELPPANAKPLSAIIKMVEDRGYKVISEVEFEDGKWEVEVHQAGGKEVELHVEAMSGQIVAEK
jgi:hypothetical protein